MKVERPGVPVAVITAHGNVESAVRALKLGAFDFVSKPLDVGDLRKLVATAVRLRGANGRRPSRLPRRRPRRPRKEDDKCSARQFAKKASGATTAAPS